MGTAGKMVGYTVLKRTELSYGNGRNFGDGASMVGDSRLMFKGLRRSESLGDERIARKSVNLRSAYGTTCLEMIL